MSLPGLSERGEAGYRRWCALVEGGADPVAATRVARAWSPAHPLAGVADIAYIVGRPDPRLAAVPMLWGPGVAIPFSFDLPISMGAMLDAVTFDWPRRVYDWMADGL